MFNPPELKALDRADPEVLLHAIACVQADYEREGKEPGAEKWQSDTRYYRAAMIADVRQELIRISGSDELMPWHDDFIAELWVKFRKLVVPVRCKWWEYFGIDIPERLKARMVEADA